MMEAQFLWSKILLITCLLSLAVDPMFFYIPEIDFEGKRLVLNVRLIIIACALRTFLDLVYIVFRLLLRYRARFVYPSSSRDELVVGFWTGAKRYLSSYFIIDILSIIPLPQVILLRTSPSVDSASEKELTEMGRVKYILLLQYVLKIIRILLVNREIRSSDRIVGRTPWSPPAYYYFCLYVIANHVVGSLWYMLSVESEIRCWRQELKNNASYISEEATAELMSYKDFYPPFYANYLSVLNGSCPLKNSDEIDDPSVFNFGIYIDALRSGVVGSTTTFPQKFFYCFWWAVRNVSSLGQNLKTSLFLEEILFSFLIAICGMTILTILLGNIQQYSNTAIRCMLSSGWPTVRYQCT